MNRLAALERKLVEGGIDSAPAGEAPPGHSDRPGSVLITKNYGHLVGGSLSHGHQQIAFSNVMPRRFRDNQRFEDERGEVFSAYLQRENPSELTVKDYGSVRLLVPYFMRRPYDMILALRDTTKQYLHQLSEAEMAAVAEGWHDATRAIHASMPRMGRETAYLVAAHNGPGAGLYFEFLPYTQEIGGFEHLGLIVCQADPGQAAAQLREVIGSIVP
jgi:galactose-1-phosphate uridylyltransferase